MSLSVNATNIRASMVEMAIFNTSGLTSSFAGMNLAANYTIYTGNGFQDPVKILKIYNGSNVGVTISFDGITQNDYIPALGTLIVDLQTNHFNDAAHASGTLNIGKGQILYGKGTAGTGNVYISGYL